MFSSHNGGRGSERYFILFDVNWPPLNFPCGQFVHANSINDALGGERYFGCITANDDIAGAIFWQLVDAARGKEEGNKRDICVRNVNYPLSSVCFSSAGASKFRSILI